MPWFLQLQDGNRFVDVAALDEGQSIVVGRSQNADVACPHDGDMSSRHASLQIKDGQCQVQDLQSTNGCFLNDERVQSGILNLGDLLRCGNTFLRLESTDQPSAADSSVPGSVQATDASVPVSAVVAAATADAPSATSKIPEALQQCQGFVADTAAAVIEQFSLQELISLVPDAADTPADFADRLTDAEDPSDVLKFLSYALPKRLGVWWAIQCIRSESGLASDEDGEILDLVSEWVRNPQDDTRRAAMQLAEDRGMKTAAAWCAVAAFWSTGSMSPPGQPEVPAADDMAGRAITGATTLASVVSPEQAPTLCQAFAQLGQDMAGGQQGWAAASA